MHRPTRHKCETSGKERIFSARQKLRVLGKWRALIELQDTESCINIGLVVLTSGTFKVVDLAGAKMLEVGLAGKWIRVCVMPMNVSEKRPLLSRKQPLLDMTGLKLFETQGSTFPVTLVDTDSL